MDFPEDLILEILGYLDIADMLRTECVSKIYSKMSKKTINFNKPISASKIIRQYKTIPNWCFKARGVSSFTKGYISVYRRSNRPLCNRQLCCLTTIYRDNVPKKIYLNKFEDTSDLDISSLSRESIEEYSRTGWLWPKFEHKKRSEKSISLVLKENSIKYISYQIMTDEDQYSELEFRFVPCMEESINGGFYTPHFVLSSYYSDNMQKRFSSIFDKIKIEKIK